MRTEKEYIDNPYKYNNSLNSKITLINKDVLDAKLTSLDALVLQTHRNYYKQPTPYRQKILRECGSRILEELQPYDSLSLSECFITNSHSLSDFRKIIHVVLPKYTVTYQNACESSLHLAIRNIFDQCIQTNIRSICFGPEIFKPSKAFPLMSAITVVCRTVRKCMQKLGDKFDRLVFSVEDKEIYDKFRENLKMYFPRNKKEEMFYAKFLPDIKETEYGDVILPERYMNVKVEFEKKNKSEEKIESKIKNTNMESLSDIPVNSNKLSVEQYYVNAQDDFRNYKM